MGLDQLEKQSSELSSAGDHATERARLIGAVRDWGYLDCGVPSHQELCRGRRVLDIGMGVRPHSIRYIEGGAVSYIGVDPHVRSNNVPDLKSSADPRNRTARDFPFSAADIERIYPNVHLYSDFLENVASEVKAHRSNIALLSAVTEHLRSPDKVFQTIWELLDRDGILWASHCNYYSWTGHHAYPRSVASWNRNDPEQNAVVDWKHL
jgi:SAM-dependent methyltransferase